METANGASLFRKICSKDLGIKGVLYWERGKAKERIFGAIATSKFIGENKEQMAGELGNKWNKLNDEPSSWKKWEAQKSNEAGGSSSRHFQ